MNEPTLDELISRVRAAAGEAGVARVEAAASAAKERRCADWVYRGWNDPVRSATESRAYTRAAYTACWAVLADAGVATDQWDVVGVDDVDDDSPAHTCHECGGDVAEGSDYEMTVTAHGPDYLCEDCREAHL